MIKGNKTLEVGLYYWDKGEGASDKLRVRLSKSIIEQKEVDRIIAQVTDFINSKVMKPNKKK